MPEHAQLDLELRIRAELAEARLGDLRHALEDMRQARDDALEERNRWRGQAERLALPAPEESHAADPSSPPMVALAAGGLTCRAASRYRGKPACEGLRLFGRRPTPLRAAWRTRSRTGARRHQVEQQDSRGFERAWCGDGPLRALEPQHGE